MSASSLSLAWVSKMYKQSSAEPKNRFIVIGLRAVVQHLAWPLFTAVMLPETGSSPNRSAIIFLLLTLSDRDFFHPDEILSNPAESVWELAKPSTVMLSLTDHMMFFESNPHVELHHTYIFLHNQQFMQSWLHVASVCWTRLGWHWCNEKVFSPSLLLPLCPCQRPALRQPSSWKRQVCSSI